MGGPDVASEETIETSMIVEVGLTSHFPPLNFSSASQPQIRCGINSGAGRCEKAPTTSVSEKTL